MRPPEEASIDAAAKVLALMVARRGQVVASDLPILDRHNAFQRLGINRERFVELAEESLSGLGNAHHECSWLEANDQAYVDGLLDSVAEVRLRHLVCRLAAAVVAGDGHPAHDDRLVYHHVLGHWHIDPSSLIEDSK